MMVLTQAKKVFFSFVSILFVFIALVLMTGSVNKVILVGNLGQDPKIHVMKNGSKMVSFSVATSEQWKDKTGAVKNATEWHRVVVFIPKLAEILERILKKGKRVYVEGSHHTRKWVDKEGREQRMTEVVVRFQGKVLVLDSKPSSLDREIPPHHVMEKPTAEPREEPMKDSKTIRSEIAPSSFNIPKAKLSSRVETR